MHPKAAYLLIPFFHVVSKRICMPTFPSLVREPSRALSPLPATPRSAVWLKLLIWALCGVLCCDTPRIAPVVVDAWFPAGMYVHANAGFLQRLVGI